jgi:hypothetical protein
VISPPSAPHALAAPPRRAPGRDVARAPAGSDVTTRNPNRRRTIVDKNNEAKKDPRVESAPLKKKLTLEDLKQVVGGRMADGGSEGGTSKPGGAD